VEQKNGAIVRHLVGYDRYASKAAYAQLARVYRLVRLHGNFFQPTQKLLRKTREGAKARRVYDAARTPFQRLQDSGALDPAKQAELESVYRRLNPLQLRRQIDVELEQLWTLRAKTITATPADNDSQSHGETSVSLSHPTPPLQDHRAKLALKHRASEARQP
jgi:hypothetical protein